ncbi:MAG: ATP-binding protein [Thermomicrobiales bacterium]
METLATASWVDANQRYLSAVIAGLRAALERHASVTNGQHDDDPPIPTQVGEIAAATAALSAPPALEVLRTAFRLSPFERGVLLLCAAVELDATILSLCASLQGDPQKAYPTLSLALAILPNPHWSALAPNAPLRRWRLIEMSSGPTLTLSPLRIDERVLHYLTGVRYLDARLASMIDPIAAPETLVPSHRMIAERIGMTWQRTLAEPPVPVVQLTGPDAMSKRAIASAACNAVGLQMQTLSAAVLPTAPGELDELIRLWEREAVLSASALYLNCDELDVSEVQRMSAIARLTDRLGSPLVLSSRDGQRNRQRPAIAFDVQQPGMDEQGDAWNMALGDAASRLNGFADTLVSQFNLSATEIRAASAEVRAALPEEADTARIEMMLWDACRTQSRARLDDLAQRVTSPTTWIDLVLPEAQRQILKEIAVHVRHRAKVYQQWGFAGRGSRGLGISALFVGASGTGKTMAAEVLANELRLDLYRIDLSSVVSKYIGETEKNLRRVFDAAEAGGAILLFDEADALFGKRSEVKDSHDRYANIEVGYLLQRMEAYRGLAILTSNLKSALDTAFYRRIRFVVPFPFPDAVQRTEIWRRIFPPEMPTHELDLTALGRLNVAGGNIRNIALNAAFLAADAGEPVRMSHLLRAARAEYAKLEKPLTVGETANWV